MATQSVKFKYTKDNGEERTATGNLQPKVEPKGTGKPSPVLVIKYFDVDADGWRSFRADRFIGLV